MNVFTPLLLCIVGIVISFPSFFLLGYWVSKNQNRKNKRRRQAQEAAEMQHRIELARELRRHTMTEMDRAVATTMRYFTAIITEATVNENFVRYYGDRSDEPRTPDRVSYDGNAEVYRHGL